jgi:hypothetical protein
MVEAFHFQPGGLRIQPYEVSFMYHLLTAYPTFIKRLSLVAGLFILAACSTALVTDPNARNYVPSPGSKVTVKQRLEIAGGQTRVFLQDGKLLPKASRLDEYVVNCSFEINTLAETPRYLEAGVYTVTRSWREEKQIVQHKPAPLRLATAKPINLQLSDSGQEGHTMTFEEIRMRLESERPSDIRELACRGSLDDPSLVVPPTLAEIRRALGNYASISVPEEK